MKATILETRGLTRAFGGLTAVDGVDLSVESGRITAVIGPNGAGKTTLFNLIAGVYLPSSGEILFEGKPLGKAPPHRRAALGIARTFQNVLLFDNMTALENVMAGQHPRSRCGFLDAALRLPRLRREEERTVLTSRRFLNLVGLGMYADRSPASLPLGQQKLLTIARALATEPRLLLLDEPGAGLNALEKQSLSDLIRRIREMGITIILVEHDMDLVMGIAERVVVLDSGQKIAEGTASQVQKDKRVIAAYLGEEDEAG